MSQTGPDLFLHSVIYLIIIHQQLQNYTNYYE